METAVNKRLLKSRTTYPHLSEVVTGSGSKGTVLWMRTTVSETDGRELGK